MSLFDQIEDKAKDMMNDPAQRAKIEQLAKDKGLTLEAAAKHFAKHGDK